MNPARRQRLLIIVMAVCIGAFVLDSFIVTPLISLWQTRAKRIAELTVDLEKGQMLVERATSLNERRREMIGESLPANNSAAENQVLNALDTWAADSRLSNVGLRPRWVQDDALGRKLEVRVSVTGSLDRISRFMHALESDAIPLRVDQFELRARDDKGQELNLETQVSSIMLAEADQ